MSNRSGITLPNAATSENLQRFYRQQRRRRVLHRVVQFLAVLAGSFCGAGLYALAAGTPAVGLALLGVSGLVTVISLAVLAGGAR